MNTIQFVWILSLVSFLTTPILNASLNLDKETFLNSSTGAIESPYSTTSINTMSPSNMNITIERKMFEALYTNAFNRSETLCNKIKSVVHFHYEQDDVIQWGTEAIALNEVTEKQEKLLTHLEKNHANIVNIGTLQKSADIRNDNPLLPERDLLLLLQWSYGIIRINNTTKIMLNINQRQATPHDVTPRLLAIIDKHKKHEMIW